MKNTNQDEFDRELDAALAQYAAVEPRAGLEERVLSNLRSAIAETERHRPWWGLAAALMAMIMVALALAWTWGWPSGKPLRKPTVIAQRPVANMQNTPSLETGMVSAGGNPVHPHSEAAHKRRHSPPILEAANAPKLDQFPSPQPLSEQEKILADYVQQFHDQAIQIARITNTEVQRDRMEVIGPPQAAPTTTEHGSMLSR